MAMDPEDTHYRALGLGRDASASEIRSAYRRLAWLLHPDRYADRPDNERRFAEERMRAVNQAWTVLGNPTTKADYDHVLRVTTANAATATRSGSTGTAGPTGGPGTSTDAESSAQAGPRRAPDDPATYERFDADPRWRRDDGSVRLGDDVAEGIWVTPLVAFLIRRGPLIAVLALAFALFVGTAYAGRNRWEPDGSTVRTTVVTCTTATGANPIGTPPSEVC